MSSEPASQESAALSIAQAERRLRMVERLSEAGLRAAENLARRAAAPEVGNEAARDGLAYAKVARAVRLSLILEIKIDEQILALRDGLALNTVPWTEPAHASGAAARLAGPGEPADADDRERTSDSLVEREHERLPSGDFRDWVETICEELELDPDGPPGPTRSASRVTSASL